MILLPDEASYFTPDTRLPPYLPFPLFLLRSDLSMTACAIYALLLYRAVLSAKNGWTDEQGWVYVIYPEEDLGKTLGRGRTAVSRALGDLEAAGLLERRPQPDHPANRLYVKLFKKQPEACSENGTRHAPKTEHAMSRKRNTPCSEKGTQVNIYNKYNNKIIKRNYSYQEEESL